MGRAENVAVFEDTEKMCRTNQTLITAIKKSRGGQKLVLENEVLPEMNDLSGEPAKIFVSKKRSFEAASAYLGKKVCVHNFASATNPGGGVTKGSSAQEEALCRCSTLYFNLNTQPMWDGFYSPHRAAQDPLHNDDCIYTPGVVVFKTDTDQPKIMKEQDWYTLDVITCAAPNLRLKPANSMNPGDGAKKVKITDKALLELHQIRMRRIMNLAALNGVEVLILGAFGCGAFENSPEVVARALKTVAEEYRHAFEIIEFAVYCTPRDDTNYKVFERAFRGI